MMSRSRLFSLALALLLLASPGCSDETCPESADSGVASDAPVSHALTDPEQFTLHPHIAAAIKASGFTAHMGKEPPIISGRYKASGEKLDSADGKVAGSWSNRPYNLCEQTTANTLSFDSPESETPEAFISGSGASFTVWAEQHYKSAGAPVHEAVLLSGKKEAMGELRVKMLTVKLNTNVIAEAGWWSLADVTFKEPSACWSPQRFISGYHASGRGDAPAGETLMVLDLLPELVAPGPKQPNPLFQCNALLDGRRYLTLHLKGDTAGSYTAYSGSVATLPAGRFTAVVSERIAGQVATSWSVTDGTVTLDNPSNDGPQYGRLDLVLGGQATSFTYATNACDISL